MRQMLTRALDCFIYYGKLDSDRSNKGHQLDLSKTLLLCPINKKERHQPKSRPTMPFLIFYYLTVEDEHVKHERRLK